MQAHKAPKQEPEKPLVPKRVDARDAREVARKLFRSGAIPAIQKPQMKQDQLSFKRPKGQERKRPAVDSTITYQPFSATQSDPFSSSGDDGDHDSNNRKWNSMNLARLTSYRSFSHSLQTIRVGTRSRRTRFK